MTLSADMHIRSVRAKFDKATGTSPQGFSPSLLNMPVQVNIEYARPTYTSVKSSNSGYKPAFDRLKGKLEFEYGSAVHVSGWPGRTSSFEITANGELLHSKLGGKGVGGGMKVDTTGVPVWTSTEYEALVTKLKPLM